MSFRHLPLERPYVYGFRWHHDGWGRKFNVMVLLTEVGEDDPYMSYLMKSHRRYHGYDGFKTFSHAKGIYKQSKFDIAGLAGMRPPYGPKTESSIKMQTKV